MSNILKDIYDWIVGNDKKKKKKRKKKERERAETERQRQIELERQRQIELERQAKSKRRQFEIERRAEEEKQKIRSIASLFANKSLCELTYQKIMKAKNLEELRIVYKEAICAQNIEMYINTLSDHYHEVIIRKFHNTYSKSNNLKELQAILEDVKQFRLVDSLLHSIKSCSLSKKLQQLTNERVEHAEFNIDELQRIKKEVSCARIIEQCTQELDEQKHQEIYKKLEYAYWKRDLDSLQAILIEVKN